MAFQQKIIDRAKELFFEIDNIGNQTHTTEEMATLIHKEFTTFGNKFTNRKPRKNEDDNPPDRSTIAKWVKSKGWDEELEEIKARTLNKRAAAEKERVDAEQRENDVRLDALSDKMAKESKTVDQVWTAGMGLIATTVYITGLKYHGKKDENGMIYNPVVKNGLRFTEEQVDELSLNHTDLIRVVATLDKSKQWYGDKWLERPTGETPKEMIEASKEELENMKAHELMIMEQYPELRGIVEAEYSEVEDE